MQRNSSLTNRKKKEERRGAKREERKEMVPARAPCMKVGKLRAKAACTGKW